MQRNTTLRKVGRSIFFTIPVDIVRAYGLEPGDTVSIDADENGGELKFFWVRKTETPAVRGQEREQEAVEAG